MVKRKKKRHPAEDAAPTVDTAAGEPETAGVEANEAGDTAVAEDALEDVPTDTAGLIESADEAVARLTMELDSEKDRYLRLAAEFDNFRKRMVREKSEMWSRAQADVVSTLLEALDDLSRVADLDPSQTSASDIVDGVELVERKLMRELEKEGLQRTGIQGERFDPNYHEAVATAPAPTEDEENNVAAVLQAGYRLGKNLLRPARVQVYVEQPNSGEPEA